MLLAHATPTCRQLKRCGSAHFPHLPLLLECASQNHQKPIRPLAQPILSRRMKHWSALAAPGGLPESVYGFIGLLVESPSGYLMKVRAFPSTQLGTQK